MNRVITLWTLITIETILIGIMSYFLNAYPFTSAEMQHTYMAACQTGAAIERKYKINDDTTIINYHCYELSLIFKSVLEASVEQVESK